MPSFVDGASAILRAAESRLETAAQNVSNASTSGFKRKISFPEQLNSSDSGESSPTRQSNITDFSQGRLTSSDANLDLAISGSALFLLRDGEEYVFSRGGSFQLGSGGMLTDIAGRVLQQSGGGDVSLSTPDVEILEDGSILEHGLPVARIGLFEADDPAALRSIGGSTYTAPLSRMQETESSAVRQSYLEASNVVMSDEMISIMASVRQAESGGRLVQLYNQVMGQAVTTFSRSGQ